MKTGFIGFFVYILIMAAFMASSNAAKDKNYESVLKIDTPVSTGTGFVAKYSGVIVGITNYHVCQRSKNKKLTATDSFGNKDTIVILSVDASKDLCLFKVGKKLKVKPADLDFETVVTDMQKVSVWGYPEWYNLSKVDGYMFDNYLVRFYCDNMQRCKLNNYFWLVNAQILSGNSGSPVFHKGMVVGVVFANDEHNYGYVIPNYMLKDFLLKNTNANVLAWN